MRDKAGFGITKDSSHDGFWAKPWKAVRIHQPREFRHAVFMPRFSVSFKLIFLYAERHRKPKIYPLGKEKTLKIKSRRDD
jgi:hypothetical protein